FPGDPRGDHVRVVAAADRRERVGLLDSRLNQDVPVEPYASDLAAVKAGPKLAERIGVLVDDSHRMTLVFEYVGKGRSDSPASHDHYMHDRPSSDGGACTKLCSPARAGLGRGATSVGPGGRPPGTPADATAGAPW